MPSVAYQPNHKDELTGPVDVADSYWITVDDANVAVDGPNLVGPTHIGAQGELVEV